MKIKLLIILGINALLLISCSTCKTEKIKSDTVEENVMLKYKHLKKKKLSPGTAKISVTYNSEESNNNFVVCTVQKILGYGPASPVLNKEQKIKIKVKPEQKDKFALNENNLVIIVKKLPPGRNQSSDIWQLIHID